MLPWPSSALDCSDGCQRPGSPKSMTVATLSTFPGKLPLFVACGPTDVVTRKQGSTTRGHGLVVHSLEEEKEPGPHTGTHCGAMALLSSAATAAVCAQVAPRTARPWRHGEVGVSCVGRVTSGVKCRAQATEATSAQAEVTSAVAESAAAETTRPLWLPGSTPPAYLDGTLAGDFGFDPLELGSDPNDLRWYVQAELVHARFAMAGVAGILFTDLLRASGRTDIPLWYEAGAYKFDFADTKTLFLVQLILMGFVETKRWMDFVKPGSQAAEDSFFGFEPAFEGLDNGYPGGPIFNPLGFAKNKNTAQLLRWKEIKNGRLAMVAMVGFFVQAYVTKTGPIENLMAHLSDPLHTTVIQRIANH